jgi:DNA helicase-2/ATP-dependent DNA helicase PcrA
MDVDRELNAEQRAAVLAPDGPVLIIAAAGTGKTRTLTYRVAHLVERGIDPQRILLLTFTNRAAGEMLERARGLVGEAVGGLWGGTFHHMANRMLRRHAAAVGYASDYTILDSDDARQLVRRCVEELNLEKAEIPKPDVLMSLFGLAVSREVPVADIATQRFERFPIRIDDVVRVHELYQARKQEQNAMDFDDLLVNGLRLFRQRPDILERYQERFLHVLVDEYQDTNAIQSEWVDGLAGRHRNLLVVGDDFQSIYSWRGADFRNFLSFPQRYPDARVFKLETNYRSVPEILELANATIAHNPDQFQKTLRAVRETYHRPRLVKLLDGDAQSRFILGELVRLRREGYRLREIVVLYRSHYQAMELQLELTRQRMPYLITSGVRFFEQAHIKDVCSMLRLMANPIDQLAFLRLLELLPRVGKRSASRIWESLGRCFRVREEADRRRLREQLPRAAAAKWEAIEEIMLSAGAGDADGRTHSDLMEDFVDGFYSVYAVETFENYDRRLEDIGELIHYSARFSGLEEFLSEVALMTNLDAEADVPDDPQREVLRLSTVHQAKGLEWKVVFILWTSEGMFPSARAVQDGAESEERRLFYVATTRARDELYLCAPQHRRDRDGGSSYYAISRFIKELPPRVVEEVRFLG